MGFRPNQTNMKQATRKDKARALEILAKTFDEVQGIKWVVNCNEHKEERLRALAEYAFEKSFLRNGVFLSDDETGVALFYRNNAKGNLFLDIVNEVKLIFKAISISRIPEILKRESYRSKLRPQKQDYYYFWMFGVIDEGKGRGSASELKNALLKKAEDEGLPIYAETSIERNCKVYERMGFQLYHYWEVKAQDIQLWFVRKEFASINAF